MQYAWAILAIIIIAFMIYISYGKSGFEDYVSTDGSGYNGQFKLAYPFVPTTDNIFPSDGPVTTPLVVKYGSNLMYTTFAGNYLNKAVYVRHRTSGLYLSATGDVPIGGTQVALRSTPRDLWSIGIDNATGSNNIKTDMGSVYGFNTQPYNGGSPGVASLLYLCGGCIQSSIPIKIIPETTGIGFKLIYSPAPGSNPYGMTVSSESGVITPCYAKYDQNDVNQIWDIYLS